jgi:hypothetical protein
MNETAPADWQKGFALDLLKSFGALFKARHKAHVYGAFGLTKERDVAEALSHNRLIWKGSPPAVEAAAIFAPLRNASDQQDFTQRHLFIPAGSIVVKAFACATPEAGTAVLAELDRRAGDNHGFWVEIFEEDEAAREAVKRVGLEYAFTKISAGSEIKGMYTRADSNRVEPLPVAELATQVVVDPKWLSADEHQAVLDELGAYGDKFAQHYSDYNKRKSWTSFALRGYADDPSFIIKPAEMSKAWKQENAALLPAQARWTAADKHFPQTRKLVERLGLEFDRVRFMRLRSKNGELSRHADITDREAGLMDGFVARLHVPIKTTDAVTFYGWDARGRCHVRRFAERSLFYLDQRKPHAVLNKDPSFDRVHLVMDAYADERLRGMIARAAVAAADPS